MPSSRNTLSGRWRCRRSCRKSRAFVVPTSGCHLQTATARRSLTLAPAINLRTGVIKTRSNLPPCSQALRFRSATVARASSLPYRSASSLPHAHGTGARGGRRWKPPIRQAGTPALHCGCAALRFVCLCAFRTRIQSHPRPDAVHHRPSSFSFGYFALSSAHTSSAASALR